MNPFITMIRFTSVVWLPLMLLLLSGCGVGPSMMRADRLTYNDAVQFTERQELLLNIVRLRYNDGPGFLATQSISTQFEVNLGAAAGADVGDDQQQRTSLFNIGGAVGYSERPTITFTPQNEKEFTQQLISPVGLEVIFLLIHYGWDVDRVLRLTTEGINGLKNDTVRETPTPNYAQRLQEFACTVKELQKLKQLGLIEFAYDNEEIAVSGPISEDKVGLNDILKANEGDYRLEYRENGKTYRLKKTNRHLVLRLGKNADRHPGLDGVRKHLNLDEGFRTYRVYNEPGSQIELEDHSEALPRIVLSTRSVLGTMAYLAQGVRVPAEHVEAGVVLPAGEKSTAGVIADLFQIRVQPEKPEQGVLTIPYRGHWFYIDETDISSKRTMGVLNSLVRLKIRAGSAQNVPVLTLPVGR
jgi:hypothetical protein